MSGRKSCEVVDLLAHGLKARDMTNDVLNRSLTSCQKTLLQAGELLRNIQGQVGDRESLSEEAETMFGVEGRKQAKNCQALRDRILKRQIEESAIDNCRQRLHEMDAQVQACDAEADNIRRAISGKSGYCDNEYRRAGCLKDRYEQLASDRKQLEREMRGAVAHAESILREVQAEKTQFDAQRKAVQEMNVMGKNRQAANALKQQIDTAWQELPKDWAEKFFADQAAAFERQIEALQKASDEEVIKGAPALKSALDAFCQTLVEKVSRWTQEKNEAEAARQKAEQITAADFVDARDYNRDGEQAKRTRLFPYIGQYEKTDHEAKYEAAWKKAEAAMAEERFADAKKAYDTAGAVAAEGREYALSLQENMIKKLELAALIEDVMYDLHYTTETSVIDDNPNRGFRVVCTAGSEVINFTKIDYDEAGKPVVDVDHQESTSGDCHQSWPSISQRMRQRGLPLTDVKKNGRSLLALDGEKSTITKRPKGQRVRGE